MGKGKILMKKYELVKILGQGNFAKVYCARNVNTDQCVAIKVIDKGKILKEGLDLQIKREISTMGRLRHTNILQIYEVMASITKIYLVLEYAKGGELYSKVMLGRLKEDVARWVFQQLIGAVVFCHSRGVYHRDLKLENLLLDEDGILKVADFGLSMLVEPNGENIMLRTLCGTPAYVAPEMLSRKGYDGAKADIWSCGVILYSMMSGRLPFRGSNTTELYRKIRRAEYKCPSHFSPEVHKLVAKILDPNPKTRITMAKIMEDPWFRKGLGAKPAFLESRPRELGNVTDDITKVDTEIEQESGTRELGNAAADTTEVETVIEQEPRKLRNMNAFEIISLSSGFDLSGMFVDDEKREDVRFVSQQPTSTIVSKLSEVAEGLELKVMKKNEGCYTMSRMNKEANGSVRLDVEVFELTDSFHVVELKKAGGDAFEYRRLMRDIKPELNDIVKTWQVNQISKPFKVIL